MIDLHEHKSSGALLRSFREKRGYSLRQLATKAYLGKSLIERYEQGTALPPSKQTVDCLVIALGCSPQEAFTLECLWLIDLLVNRGVDRERASSMVVSSENSLAANDIEQVIRVAHEAIDLDAFEKALRWLEPVREMHQAIEKALPSLEYYLGEAKYGSGYIIEAAEHYKQALQLLGHRQPEIRLQRFLSLCHMTVRQTWNRIRPKGFSESQSCVQSDHGKNNWQIVVDACYRLSHIHYLSNERELATYYSLKGLNIAEASPMMSASDYYQALFFANVATAAGFSGIHSLARLYIRCIEALKPNLDNPRVNYGVDLVLGVYFFGRAKWEDCEARFERAARIAEEAGNLRHARESEAFLASAYYWQGHWSQSFTLFNHLYRKAKQCGDHQIMALAFYSKALGAFHRGRLDYALKFAQTAECLAGERLQDHLVQIQVNGLLVAIYSRQNKLDQANNHAKVIEDLSQMTATTAGTLEGYYRLSEYYLWGWETFGTKDFKQGARRAVKRMYVHARIFDVFRPLYWTYQGWYEFLSGKPDKAIKFVSRGIREAHALKMSYHESLAQQCLANLMAHVDGPG